MKEMNPLKCWQRTFRAASSAVILLLLFSFASGAAVDSPPAGKVERKRIDVGQVTKANKVPRFAEQELLVKFRKTAGEDKKTKIHVKHGAQILREYKSIRLQRAKLREGISIEEAIAEYQADPDVEYAEPNYTVSAAYNYPNDAQYWKQWGLTNIKASKAWDLTTGSHDIVVAVIDTGIDYTHVDLVANMWFNPGEIAGNRIDDDGNGYIDDIHGINAITGSGDPMDDHYHGTHVAGIIGAVGNNNIGVAGVNWNVDMIGCKFISGSLGYGYTSDAVECLDYLKDLKERAQNPVNIIVSNNSWGGGDYSQALYDAIAVQPDILFVAGAGNDGSSNDAFEFYPASYPLPNILSVAATENNDSLASYSNFGKRNVDIAAPGSTIHSTMPGNSYADLSGTSMASPHAAGTAALLAAYGKNWKQARNLLLTGGDPVAGLAERTLTGQRINAYGSLACSNRTLLKPLDLPDSVTSGVPSTLSAISIICDVPWGPVSVTVNGTETLHLLDNGVSPDLFADDGVFSGRWTPSSSATQSLAFNSPAGSSPVALPLLRISETTVVDPPATFINPTAVSTATNVPFRQDFNATGGLAPLTWSLAGGSLPTGLVLDSNSGEVTGTPTSPGAYTYDVKVTDANGTTDVMWDRSLLVNDGIRPNQPIIMPGYSEETLFIQPSPVFADLDGDGRDEIIVVNESTLYVYDEVGLIASKAFPYSVSTPAVADLDRDGQLEIVVTVSWWLTPAPPIYALEKDLTVLPGFPTYGGIDTITQRCGYQDSPVISDLNNDGNLSIISICTPNYMYDPNYNKDIVTMVDAQGKTLAGWPKAIGTYDDTLDNMVAVGDLDGNNRKEIILFSADGILRVFDKQGNELAKWTVFSGSGRIRLPVLADFNGDGHLEIAVVTYRSQMEVIIFDRFGSLLPGWPRSYYGGASTGLMAADMNIDGRAELVFTSRNSGSFDRYLQVLSYDGTSLAGWPVYTDSYTQGFEEAAIGDVNGDGEQEIVVIDMYNSLLDGFDRNGARLAGYPKDFLPETDSYFRAANPALGDLDGNDRVDIVVKTDDSSLYIWESPQTYASPWFEWPMFGHDPQHSNLGAVRVTHTVTPLPGAGGTLSPATAQVMGHGSTMSFTVTPDSGYEIDSVTGCGGTLSGNTFTTGPITADCTVTATFTDEHTLYLIVNGSGSVHTSPGPDLACTGGCAQRYGHGTTVALTATPASGYSFEGWGGACSGTGDCTVAMDTAKSVTVTFQPLACAAPASLTVPATYTASSLAVSWEASPTEGVTYKLERSLNGGAFTTVYSGTALTYTVTNLVNGSYVFRVKAVKSGYVDSAYQTAAPCVVTLTAGTPPTLNVPATDFDGSFIVNWGASTPAGVSYVLELAIGEGEFTEAYSGTGRSYTASGLDGTYAFRVKAVKSGYVDSDYQTAAPCVVTVTAVDAPASLTVPVADTDGSFTVNWGVSGMAGVTYKLERSDNDGPFIQVYSGTALKYTVNGLESGSYAFRLKAVKSGYVDSAWQFATCAVTVTAVEAPASITVPMTDTDGAFTVSWETSATEGVTYKLERSSNGGAFIQVYSGTALSYEASGLTDGSYAFRVKAVKAGYVDSPYQNAAACAVTVTAVEAPGAITAPEADTDGIFTVNWGASATEGVTYKLERSSNGGAFIQVYSGADLSYEVNGQGNGSYVFRVKAVKNSYIDSTYQTVASPCVVTLTAEMPASFNVPVMSTTSSITVSWEASATAGVTYKLERSDDNGQTFAQIYSGTALSYPVNDLTNGSYLFRVKAVKSGFADSAYQTAAPCVVALYVTAAPASITVPATDFDGTFTVSWGVSATAGVTYKLERSDDNGQTFAQIYSGTALSYSVSGLSTGNYTFQVKAVKSGYADSAWQFATCAVTVTAVEAPASITVPATDTDGIFTVNWEVSPMEGVTYKLERADNGGLFTLVYSGSDLSYAASGLATGNYTFQVSASKSGYLDSVYQTATCVVTLTAVEAPASITVPATSTSSSLTVNWGASQTDGVTYRLERALNSGAFTQVYSGNDQTYTASGLSNGSYTFRVMAVKDGYVDSAYQSATCVVTVTAVDPPASITVPAISTTSSFMVNWGASPTEGVTYKLERSTNGGAFIQVYSGADLSYETSGQTNTSYVFRVKAVKTSYPDSVWQTSSECKVMLPAGIPPSLNVPATDTDGSFIVNWTASATTGVTYVLERSFNGGDFVEVYRGTTRSYAASGLGDGSYAFRVKAVKSGYLDSPWQTAAPCTVTVTAVGTPASITVPATDADGAFNVSWVASATSGVTYKLERSADGGETFTQVYSGTSKAYSVSGLSSGSYVFRVKSVKSGYLGSTWQTSEACLVTLP